MLPYATLIEINRNAVTPVFLQIANAIILYIKKGIIPAQTRLPGTRQLAEILGVHRKTVIAAFEELYVQGWIEQIPSRGTFVSKQIPEIKPRLLEPSEKKYPEHTGFFIKDNPVITNPVIQHRKMPGFDDGFPDIRLAPLDILGRKYRNILSRGFQQHLLGYTETYGNQFLREKLAGYIHQTRGLAVSASHICITRGSVMGIDLVARTLLSSGDKVLVGDPNYFTANMIFQNTGAKLIKIAVDKNGISADAIEDICKTQPIRLLYITPHHHYPTTVTLSAERRVRILQLAEKYGFAILEDDYDFDFHYRSSPILPLASADSQGMVIYVGSLAKAIAPAMRIGYVVAPTNLIEKLGYLRRLTDRQGDNVLEQAIAEMFEEGEIQRHLKKAQREYHYRRDFFCKTLSETCGSFIKFDVPEGGLAIWGEFDNKINLQVLSEKAYTKGLWISNGKYYNTTSLPLNATRLGFASMTPEESENTVKMLADLLRLTH
jgi:GntR family transcriptional regulator/MocR family aminotransferase